ncbi:hypothetical protein ACFSR6_06150 [Pedobacter vanadiisoli]|uniref:Uncharacterized protein n=1 Tax=Pedobacter vanadiisoli TaxID=1761975 RepID=A0ABW5MI38_9SPHI
MKKNKSKSKNHSTSKKLRKELESKLTTAFSEVAASYGKVKKADKTIEKFAKQLVKKITFPVINDSIEPFIKEEEKTSPALKEKVAKPTLAKTAVKKVKAPVKEEVE